MEKRFHTNRESELIKSSGGITLSGRTNTTPAEIKDLASSIHLTINDRENIAEFISEIVAMKIAKFKQGLENLKNKDL